MLYVWFDIGEIMDTNCYKWCKIENIYLFDIITFRLWSKQFKSN